MSASRSVLAFALVVAPAQLLAHTVGSAQVHSPQFSAESETGQGLRLATALMVEPPLLQTPSADDGNYAEVDEATARKLVKGCFVPSEVKGPGAPGSQIVVQLTVDEKGKLLNVHRVQGAFTHQLSVVFADCHFAVYKVNGTPTAFHANITINVK